MRKRKFLLDTNIWIFLLRNHYDIDVSIKKVGIENCYLSEITLAELIYGAYCSQKTKQKLIQIEKLTQLFSVIPISSSIQKYAEIKCELRKKGLPIDDFDLLIASTAITENMILVTDNIKHFERLGLDIQNWVVR